MPTAQSKANLKYYHKRTAEDPEYAKKIAEQRMIRYYKNQEDEKEKARMRYYAKKERLALEALEAAKTPAETPAEKAAVEKIGV